MTSDAENALLLHILSYHHIEPMFHPPNIARTTIPQVKDLWNLVTTSCHPTINHPTKRHPTNSISNTSMAVNVLISTSQHPTNKVDNQLVVYQIGGQHTKCHRQSYDCLSSELPTVLFGHKTHPISHLVSLQRLFYIWRPQFSRKICNHHVMVCSPPTSF